MLATALHNDPSPHLILLNTVQSGAEMIQPEINIIFFGGKGDIFVNSSTFKSLITVEAHYYGHQEAQKNWP